MKLILHIGGAKCGSTAIQNYLKDNRERLSEEKGILIPGTKLVPGEQVTGEQIFFFEQMREDPEGIEIVERRLSRLHQHMQDAGQTTAIISAENLINPFGFERFFIRAQNFFDIDIVLYARRQDQYFVSAWQQWHLKTYPSLAEYVDARLGLDANWADMLAPWEAALPKARITVRRFQRDKLHGQDVVTDFFETTGLGGLLDGTSSSEKNRSFSESLGEIAARNSDLFTGPHDNEFFNVMFQAIGPAVFKTNKGSFLFTLEERNRILNAYEDSNARLRAAYFGDLDPAEPLFTPPSASEVCAMSEEQKRTAENDLLARGLFNMTKRLRALEERG